MPWWNYRPRRRRWRRYWRRPRKTFFRRYARRRWVRRRRIHRKLKKIRLTQYQPKVIRKCTIRGPICLFQTSNKRLSNDFDLYDLSEVPPHFPGGGGWGLKVFSLLSLYSEHEYARNTWSVTNDNLPLCRYLGCKLIFYQSDHVDYCVTFTNELPMLSTLGMYNAMQPNIHSMLPHRLIVPSKKTYKKKKPYYKFRVGPPTQLQNKWYFQQDLAKLPLVMIRSTAMSLDQYYIAHDKPNTNLTINSIHPITFQNRNFKNPGTGYYNKQIGEVKYYLYAYTGADLKNPIPATELIPLGDTKNYTAGISYYEDQKQTSWNKESWKKYIQSYSKNFGNPFYPDYLQGANPIIQTSTSFSELYKTSPEPTTEPKITNYTIVPLTKSLRYNPYADLGRRNQAFFKSNFKDAFSWLPPENPELLNDNLPFWILLWGFPDWHRKIKKHLHLDTDYILTLTQQPDDQVIHREYIIPISDTFLNGVSPYDKDYNNRPSQTDRESWYPQLQYQVEIINDICSSGPGTAKLPDDFTVEALLKYSFYFKWGGSPAPMSQIEDPTQQIKYNIPGNELTSTSLQNPTSNPATILWNFDQRRDYITPQALKRIEKDQTTEKIIVPGGSLFQEYTPLQEAPSETSSEEEEETSLYNQLQQQRIKQRKLKRRILLTLQKLQELE